MNEYMTPNKCGESVNIGGTCICKLEIFPCAVMRNEGCAKAKIEEFMDAMKNLISEVEE